MTSVIFRSFVNGNIHLITPDCMEDQEEDEEDLDSSEEQYPDESPGIPSSNLQRSVVGEALPSKNGHFDLFLQFLLGLSLESTQEPL